MKSGWQWEHVLKHLESFSSTIWIGLSGGMDSMVLLDVLSQHQNIHCRLKAIHVNHGLSKNALHWQTFCKQQCVQRNIPFYTKNLNLNLTRNIEAQAREARYQVFLKVATPGDCLVLAHHLDDQIETMMLNLLRGTGITGLAAMPQRRDWKRITILRPFLKLSREILSLYAAEHQLKWIEDESNLNLDYSRNYLRQLVLPMIEKHWPYYRQSVLHTIEACQDMHDYVEQSAMNRLPEVSLSSHQLSIQKLEGLSEKDIMLILRMWFSEHEIAIPNRQVLKQIIQQMIFRRRRDSQPKFELGCYTLEIYRETLFLSSTLDFMPEKHIDWSNFPEKLVIENIGTLSVESSVTGVFIEKADKISIGFRQGGEKILYKGHHRSLKKLFQQLGIPVFQRNKIPLLYVNGELKAVIGYLYADQVINSDQKHFYHNICLSQSYYF